MRKEWQLGIEPIPNMIALFEDWGIKDRIEQGLRGPAETDADYRK